MARIRARAGFSLMEVMMASIVLAIAILGLLGAIFYIHRLNQSSRENELANEGATQVLESILATPHSSVASTYDGYAFDVTGLSEQDGDPDSRVGLVAIDDTDPTLLLVTVTVDWKGVAGDRSVVLESKLADRE